MQRVEAFLQPHRLIKVIQALHELPHFPGFTVFAAKGQGHGRGVGGQYTGDEAGLVYHNRQVLMVVCDDAEADAIANTIVAAAHTGNKHDGMVTISQVARVVRIGDAPNDRLVS